MLAQDREYTHCLWGLALCVSSAAGPAWSGPPFLPFATRPCAPRTACSRTESFLGRWRLNGPAQALGQGMREGILAAFEDANRAGGINGRKLELKSIDDGYEPEKTIVATNNAIKDDKIFALVGAVGTPSFASLRENRPPG